VSLTQDKIFEGRHLGVGLICRMVLVAPISCCAARRRVPCARALNDAAVIPKSFTLWEGNCQVYIFHKLRKASRCAGSDFGRDQIARLMKAPGIRAAVGLKRVKTTTADPRATRHPHTLWKEILTAAGALPTVAGDGLMSGTTL
jgi:hypothetical protein